MFEPRRQRAKLTTNLSPVCIVSAHIPSFLQELVVRGSYRLVGPVHLTVVENKNQIQTEVKDSNILT